MAVRNRHVLLALILHAILFALLAFGARCSLPPAAPKVIQAVLVDASRLRAAPAPPRSEPQKDLEEQARELIRQANKEQRVEEQQKIEDLRMERERVAKAEAIRLKEEKLKKKREEEKQKEKKKKLETEEQKKKKEDERKRVEDQERQRELQQAEDDLRNQQLASEQNELDQDRQQRAEQAALSEWAAQIADHVVSRWRRPPDSAEKFLCKVKIELLPGGRIRTRKIVQSCGNPLLDESVLKAIDKSDPLPLPRDPAVFRRAIEFTFIPR